MSEEITIELGQLINAGNDLSAKLELDPPIVTVFESKAKGKKLAAAEKKFKEELIFEILEVCNGKDPDQDFYFLQTDDIPKMAEGTLEVIREVAPDETERLFPEVKKKKVAVKKASKEPRYTRIEASVEAMAKLGIEAEKSALIAEADKLYLGRGYKSNQAEAAAVMKNVLKSLSSLQTFGFTVTSPE